MRIPDIDFRRIRPFGGSRSAGFEQFVCELVAEEQPESDATFHRLDGSGGDGGVECFWLRTDGSEDGWQAKYWLRLDEVDKAQLDESIKTALTIHPNLKRYRVAIPLDPSGKTGRKGRSLHEKVYGGDGDGGWVAGWRKMAEARDTEVDFEIVWKAGLVSRLNDIDTNGMRTKYWFDEDILPDSWWQDRLADALAAAKPKYIEALAVDVPARVGLGALAGDPEWMASVGQLVEDMSEAASTLEREASNANAADIAKVAEAARAAISDVEKWWAGPSAEAREAADKAMFSAREIAVQEDLAESNALTAEHGSWDSVGWRQFQMEYQVSFPAAAVDAIRDVVARFDSIAALLDSASGRITGASSMVLTGAFGRGKTFLVCDWLSRRLAEGRLGVLLHGKRFQDDVDPLLQLRDMLYLPSDLNGEEALALLNHAGRTSGSPVVLVIDALNEKKPRDYWRNHLDQLISAVGRCLYVRLVVTVRTYHVDDVIPSGLNLPEIEHRGFGPAEAEAIAKYAAYFGLHAPLTPPVQGEFDNPLFLRLFCEALQSSGGKSLEAPALGLSEIVDLLVSEKERMIGNDLGVRVQNQIVNRALNAIVEQIGDSHSPWLARDKADSISREIWPGYHADDSLLDAMISEGLLGEDTLPENGGKVQVVFPAFERLGQHLLVGAALKGTTNLVEVRTALQEGPFLGWLRNGDAVDPGLVEALSVYLAERFGLELTDVADILGLDSEQVRRGMLSGLTWRAATSIGQDVTSMVITRLANRRSFDPTADALFRLAVKSDHPLNVDWLTAVFKGMSMAERDALLVPWLHKNWGTGGAVDRLVEWSHSDLKGLHIDTARLWTIALLWCTGCSDRRVRDETTLAAVRVLSSEPGASCQVLKALLDVNDDWILERTLDVVHAVLLLTGADEHWRTCSRLVYEALFGMQPPDNAAVRDAARALIESATSRDNLPEDIDPARATPPYDSCWPSNWPSDDDIAPYDSPQYPKLVHSCTRDDFFTYQIEPAFHGRDLDTPGLAKKLVLEVIQLGYRPHLHGEFDHEILQTHGPGRSKPSWIERIGKKYQWIALARLVGQAADNTVRATERWDPPPPPFVPPQGVRLRQIDPTVIRNGIEREAATWVPEYVSLVSLETEPQEWAKTDDIPDVDLTSVSLNGEDNVVLAATYDWRLPETPDGIHRTVWIRITPILVKKRRAAKLIKELKGRDLTGHSVHRAPDLTSSYVAEYPFGLHARHDLHQIVHDREEPFETPTLRASLEMLGEYEYSPHDNVSFPIPAPAFFGTPEELRWDGTSRWLDCEGLVVAALGATPTGGRQALTVNKQWLLNWLKAHSSTLIWIEEAGKQEYGDFVGGGQLTRSRVRRLTAQGNLTNQPVVLRY